MTITKMYFKEEIAKHTTDLSQPKIGAIVDASFEHLIEMIKEGTAIKIPKIGWLTAQFKKGGRPARVVKSGTPVIMRDTHSINIRRKRNQEHRKVNWSDLILEMQDHTGEVVATSMFLDLFLKVLRDINEGKGERMEIRGLGSFKTRVIPARLTRNPKNGENQWKGARTAVRFKAGRKLVKQTNLNLLGHE